MKRHFWSFIPALICASLAAGEPPSAAELLNQTIAYHDPEGRWPAFAHTLAMTETRPDGTVRQIEVALDLPAGTFSYRGERKGKPISMSLKGDACDAAIDGRPPSSQEEIDDFRLSCDAIKRTRNYYTYLWGLPMKLRDPGTRLDPQAVETEFQGKRVWALKVTYEAGVGKDTWYFYLDPASKALLGTRFYHDEAKNDGEYIVFNEEYDLNGMRLPKTRAWYINADDKYLGSDELVGHR